MNSKNENNCTQSGQTQGKILTRDAQNLIRTSIVRRDETMDLSGSRIFVFRSSFQASTTRLQAKISTIQIACLAVYEFAADFNTRGFPPFEYGQFNQNATQILCVRHKAENTTRRKLGIRRKQKAAGFFLCT
jgi:hypothetical protein